MTSRRKAELQRQLSLRHVPAPPHDLAEKIKREIPNDLAKDRLRASRNLRLALGVAASIMVVITSVLVSLSVLSPSKESLAVRAGAPTAEMAERALDAPAASAPETVARANPATPLFDELQIDIRQDAAAPPPPPRIQATAGSPAFESLEQVRIERGVEGRMVGGVVGGSITSNDTFAPEPSPAPQIAESEAPREMAPAPAAPPPPPVALERQERAKASAPIVDAAAVMTAPQPSSGIVTEAHASTLKLAAPREAFGVSLDTDAFRRVQARLESGTRPDERAVDVEAIVNYFAGSATTTPRRGARLEAEISPAAVEAEGDVAVLRFSIDTPRVAARDGASTLPAASNARIEVDFASEAVHSVRPIGSIGRDVEPVLLHNLSVTRLYELQLNPHLRGSQRIATVRLQYTSLTDGKTHTVERVLRARDVAAPWSRASRRHRLATLGALWSESLQGSAQPGEIARRADELATQNPSDERARELANAASMRP